MMFKQTITALCGIVAVGLLVPTMASARPGGGHPGGGARAAFHGGGGSFHRGGGLRGAGIAAGAIGLGVAGATYGYGYGPGYDSYAYDDGGDCYLVRRQVMTPYGWRLRRVQVCN